MKILMVCLGNICRSPLAEGILKSKLKDRGMEYIEVDSAGTSNYHIGEYPDKRSIQNAKLHKIDISKLVGRQFTREDFKKFDKIYVMDTSNYRDVIELAEGENECMKVKLILNELYPNSNMSVPDPYFGKEDGFESVFQLLNEACEVIANSIQDKK